MWLPQALACTLSGYDVINPVLFVKVLCHRWWNKCEGKSKRSEILCFLRFDTDGKIETVRTGLCFVSLFTSSVLLKNIDVKQVVSDFFLACEPIWTFLTF